MEIMKNNQTKIVELKNTAKKFQHTFGVRKRSKIGCKLKRIRGPISLYLCHPSPIVTQLSAKRDLVDLWFYLQGKVRECEWVLGFPSWVGQCQRDQLFSHSIQKNPGVLQGTARRTVEQALDGQQRNANPTSCVKYFIRKPAHKSQRTSLPTDSLKWPTGTLNIPCALFTYSTTSW